MIKRKGPRFPNFLCRNQESAPVAIAPFLLTLIFVRAWANHSLFVAWHGPFPKSSFPCRMADPKVHDLVIAPSSKSFS